MISQNNVSEHPNQDCPTLWGTLHIVAWHRNYAGAPSSANRYLAVLSSLMRHAELLGLREPGSNPCQGLRRHQSQIKACYLDGEDWNRLGAQLRTADAEYPELVSFVRFLCLTGCRRGEAQSLTWSMVEAGRAILPDSKTGPKIIWLGRLAQKLLSATPLWFQWVFASRSVHHGDVSARCASLMHIVSVQAVIDVADRISFQA